MSRFEIKSPITRYFYKLSITPKPNFKKAKDSEILSFSLKMYASNAFFFLGNHYHDFLTWLTQYYPFSLLFPWQLFHAKNKILRKSVYAIEECASGLKIPMEYRGWDISQDSALLYFKIYRKIEDIDHAQRILEQELQKHSENVFVRYDDGHFKVIMPLGLLYPQFS